MDHESIDELHVLGTLALELAGDDNVDTLGTRLHDEADDTGAGTGMGSNQH